MFPPAGRLTSASRAVILTIAATVLSFATACSTDAPTSVSSLAGEVSGVNAAVASNFVTSIRTSLADKCLTVKNGLMQDGTATELRPCDGRSSQQFTFTTSGDIRIAGNYCLDDWEAKGKDGDIIVIWPCHGLPNQQWATTAAGEIRGINSKCLNVSDRDADDGTPINLTTCRDRSAQKWSVNTSTPTPPSAPASVATVAASLGQSSIAVGSTTQATAALKDANGNTLTGRTVTWTSSATAIATVSTSGLVTAKAAGTANVVATSEGKTGSATVTVTASPPTTPPPTEPPASCSALITDMSKRSVASFSKPGYLQSGLDPDFRTTITRITGDPGTSVGSGVSGSWPTVARHDYAKSQPWSADGKLFVLTEVKRAFGGGVQLFLDGETYKPLFARAHPGYEARWHPTLPDVMIYVLDNGSVGHWNPRTNSSTIKVSTSSYTLGLIGPYEGNPSADGRYLAVTANRKSDGRLVAYVADLQNGTKGADLDLMAQGFSSESALDWASVSAGGKYLIVHGDMSGTTQTIKVYDRATLSLISFWKDSPMGHFDIGFDAYGNEVIFGAASDGSYSRRFLMRRLDNGQITPLTPAISWDWHASMRAVQRPGWGLVTTNDASGSIFDKEIYWVKLDGSGTVQRLAHHRSNVTNYDANPFGVPSPDGKRIAFASNWGSSAVQTFVVDTRSICP